MKDPREFIERQIGGLIVELCIKEARIVNLDEENKLLKEQLKFMEDKHEKAGLSQPRPETGQNGAVREEGN